MNFDNLLKKRDRIYAICAVWIIFFHIFRQIGLPYISVLSNVVSIGNMAVDIFMFLSGLCLSLSAERNKYEISGWGGYFRRRFSRILLPYVLIAVPYYLYASIVEHTGSVTSKIILFVANVTSANFWLRGTQTTWFVYAIILFYLLFPLVYRLVREQSVLTSLLLIATTIGFALFSAHIPVVRHSMIVWTRMPVFITGIVCGVYRSEISKFMSGRSRWGLFVSLLIVVLLGWRVSVSYLDETRALPQELRLILYFPMTLGVSFILSSVPLSKSDRWPISKLGGLSLELYLIHITLLHPFEHYGWMSVLGYYMYLVLPGVTIIITFAVGHIERLIMRGLTGRKSK